MGDSETKTFNTLTELLTEKESTNVATIIFYNGNLEKFKQNYEIVESFGEHIKFLGINQITKMQEFTDHDIILLEDELTDISEFVCSLSECNIKTLYIQYQDEDDIDELSEIEKKNYFEVHKEVMEEESPKNINDKINLHLKQLYSKQVDTLILCKDIISFGDTHPKFYALIKKEAKKPTVKFRFLTDIKFYQGTEEEINNLCITERKTKDEMINILRKICNETESTHINSITFIDENSGNIAHLNTIEEIKGYLKYLQSVGAVEIEHSNNEQSDVLKYNPPDPLVEQFPPYEDFTTSRSHTQLPDLNTIEEDIETEESRAEKIKRLISSQKDYDTTTSLEKKQKLDSGSKLPDDLTGEYGSDSGLSDCGLSDTPIQEYSSDSELSDDLTGEYGSDSGLSDCGLSDTPIQEYSSDSELSDLNTTAEADSDRLSYAASKFTNNLRNSHYIR